LQVLDIYRKRAIVDQESSLPNPTSNREASGIPLLLEAMEAEILGRKGRRLLRDGASSALSAIEVLTSANDAIISLATMNDSARTTRRQLYEQRIRESRASFADLRETLEERLEEALSKVANIKRGLLPTVRAHLEAELERALSALCSKINPELLSPEQLIFEITGAGYRLISQMTVACCRQERLAALRLLVILRGEALKIEQEAAASISGLKEKMAMSLLAHPRSFSAVETLFATDILNGDINVSQLDARELIEEIRGTVTTLEKGQNLAGTVREKFEKGIRREITNLMVAMDMDLTDMVELRAETFCNQLIHELEKELHVSTQIFDHAVRYADQLASIESQRREEKLAEIERQTVELIPDWDLLQQVFTDTLSSNRG
jgi:hypothetical protein